MPSLLNQGSSETQKYEIIFNKIGNSEMFCKASAKHLSIQTSPP